MFTIFYQSYHYLALFYVPSLYPDMEIGNTSKKKYIIIWEDSTIDMRGVHQVELL